MVKAVIDIDMPSCCDDCIMHNLENAYDGYGSVVMTCRIAHEKNKDILLENREKPEWCPLEKV